MSEKVEKLAKDIKKLSPAGQAAVGIIIDHTGIHTEAGDKIQTSIVSKHEMLDMINDADWKMAEQKGKVRVAEEIAQDELESMAEWKAYDEAEKAFATAKEKLRVATLGNGKLNNQREKVHQEKLELKSRREILSGLLVRYAADYRVQSVEVDDANRVIVLSGRIGRKLKRNQSELPL
jgi:hypothetical protein